MKRLKERVDQKLFRPILKRRARRLGAHILKATEDYSSLLDFGCGNMVLAEYLQDNSRLTVTGVDMVDNNLTRLPFVTYEGEKLPFEDNAFEASQAVFALHHCNNIKLALNELIRVTKNKIIIIEETYHNSIEKSILYLHDWIGNHLESWSVNIPLNFLSKREWFKTFQECNLKVTTHKRVYQYSRLNFTHQILFELEPSL